MSNWISITLTNVKTAKMSLLLSTVQSIASSKSEEDPSTEMIADVVAQIRASCSVGNTLDRDTTKIPNSLKGLAKRMIIRALKDYIEQPLTPDETKKAGDDLSYINRIIDNKIRFEIPDNPAAGEMQQAGGIDTISGTNRRNWTRHGTDGLL